MNADDLSPTSDVERLLDALDAPVAADTAFRDALSRELAERLAPRRGDGPLPDGWALCPFDRFCFAERRLPRRVRMHCPCLHAAPLLRRFAGGQTPVHGRPCAALALREGGDVTTSLTKDR